MSRWCLLLAVVGCGGSSATASDASVDVAPDAPVPGTRVFATDRLHRIAIVVDPQYLDSLETDLDNRVPCTFTFDGETVPNVGIRKKGGYGSNSSLADKTGFSVKIDQFQKQRLDGLQRFLLNNAQEDPTFLSETVGYTSYREIGLISPLTSHAVMTFNGEDKGIFIIKEAVADDFLERSFGPGNDGGNVYEGFYHPQDLDLGDFALHPEELDLKDEVEQQRSRADMIAFATTVRTAADSTFETEVAARLELDHYLTALALDTLLGFWDSYAYFQNNYYLYHSPVTDKFVYIPHGMDQLQYSPPGGPRGRLAQRIREIPALDAKLDGEIARLRGAWPAARLVARIDQVKAVLETASPGSRTDQDLASFHAHFDDVRAAVAGIGN